MSIQPVAEMLYHLVWIYWLFISHRIKREPNKSSNGLTESASNIILKSTKNYIILNGDVTLTEFEH